MAKNSRKVQGKFVIGPLSRPCVAERLESRRLLSVSPLQDITATIEANRVHAKVYDPHLQQWQETISSGYASGTPVTRNTGIVTWEEFSGSAYYAHMAQYDPGRQRWAMYASTTPLTGSINNYNGMVVWDEPTTSIANIVHRAVYDPQSGSWIENSSILTAAGYVTSVINSDGVVAWLQGNQDGNAYVHASIYDYSRHSWRTSFGLANSNSSAAQLAVVNSTVTYKNASGQLVTLGYDPQAGNWYAGPTKIQAYFDARPTSGIPPLWVWVTDISIGGSGWSWTFGDGASSSDRSTYHVYNNFGTYILTQTVSRSGVGSNSRNVTISTDSTPPSGTITINGGAVFADSTSATLNLSATDNSGSVATMRLRNRDADWSTWEPYATIRAWTLTSGDGTKTVDAQFQDATGNISNVVSASITLDSTRVGQEFRLNTYTTASQALPQTAMDAQGNFVAIWMSFGQDGDDWGVFGQRYNSAGVPQGGEFQVNTTSAGVQREPRVVMAADGSFIVTWYGNGVGDDDGAFGQRFDEEGNRIGTEFRANSYTLNRQEDASVAMMPGGGFVTAWDSQGQGGGGSGIYAQRYGSDGLTIGSEFRLNAETSYASGPHLAMDASGAFTAVWYGVDGSGYGVTARRFDATGAPLGDEFQVNTSTAGDQLLVSASMNSTGKLLVTWYGPDQDGAGVFARQFSSTGNPVGDEFLVNTTQTGDQLNGVGAMDNAGGFVIAWTSAGQDGSGRGVYRRQYNSDGTSRTAEIQINATTPGDQGVCSIAIDAGGRAVVAWSGNGPGDDNGVFAQRYALGGILIGDLNFDGTVSISDFITLASNFNKTNATWADGDLNGDGVVSISDFIDLASHFGQSLAGIATLIASPQPSGSASADLPLDEIEQSTLVRPPVSAEPKVRPKPKHHHHVLRRQSRPIPFMLNMRY